MKYFTIICCCLFFLISSSLKAQVPVRKEPRHKTVLENKYLRILDVYIPPQDTTLFHVHATPSVFLILTNTLVGSQIKGQSWVKGPNVAGSVSYRSFLNDTLVHRVSNWDQTPFHVADIEVLASFRPERKNTPLPFPVVFENEKTIAYRITSSINKETISDRGPVVVALAEGNSITLHYAKTKKSVDIKSGNYQYIEPGSVFYFTVPDNGKFNLVLLEIK